MSKSVSKTFFFNFLVSIPCLSGTSYTSYSSDLDIIPIPPQGFCRNSYNYATPINNGNHTLWKEDLTKDSTEISSAHETLIHEDQHVDFELDKKDKSTTLKFCDEKDEGDCQFTLSRVTIDTLKNLQYLSLQRYNIGKKDFTILTQYLLLIPQLEKLNLKNNRIKKIDSLGNVI